jgi:outer membrane protein assembly factor BamB
MRTRIRGTLAALAVAALAAPAGAHGAAVTYQGDNARSGNVPDGPPPPLGRKWIRRDLGIHVSYPVLAEGKVYVTAQRSPSQAATVLYALDRGTGATVWVREVATSGLPAYDNGRIYVLGTNALDAVSAATGERLWRTAMDGAGEVAPAADGALVYASDVDAAYAISADTGLVVDSTSMPRSGSRWSESACSWRRRAAGSCGRTRARSASRSGAGTGAAAATRRRSRPRSTS